MTNEETELASYFARYESAIAKLGKTLRAKLQQRLPGLSEIVYLYEGQNALVISYSPTGQGYGGVCSLALDPDGVKLHFGQGASLSKADPKQLLQGRGKTVRHVVLESVADFERPEIEVLMATALTLAKVRPDPGAKGAVILKAESQKQRASRAKKKKAASAPTPKPKPTKARR